jgi:hypothetical protein
LRYTHHQKPEEVCWAGRAEREHAANRAVT